MSEFKLRCIVTSKEIESFTDVEQDHNAKVLWMKQDAKKKSSFSIAIESSTPQNANNADDDGHQEERVVSVTKPCHIYVDCSIPSTQAKEEEWKFGGMTMTSNSRNIEVYVSVKDGSSSEQYWQTHRGVLCDDASSVENKIHQRTKSTKPKWYKSVLLPPDSKPTDIIRLHLKLLSLQPSGTQLACISDIDLKGLLPILEGKSSTTTTTDKTTLSTPNSISTRNQPSTGKVLNSTTDTSSQLIDTEKIVRSITALTMMVNNVDTSMKQSLANHVGELHQQAFVSQKHMDSRITQLEQEISDVKEAVTKLKSEFEKSTTVQEQILKELIKLNDRKTYEKASLIDNDCVSETSSAKDSESLDTSDE